MVLCRHAGAASVAPFPSSTFARFNTDAYKVAHSTDDGAISAARSALASAHRRNIRRCERKSRFPCDAPNPRCLMKNLRGFSCASHAASEYRLDSLTIIRARQKCTAALRNPSASSSSTDEVLIVQGDARCTARDTL